jgi:hypothetical protein
MKNVFDDNTSDDLDNLSIKTDTSDSDFEQLSLDDTDEVPAFIHERRSDAGSNPDNLSDMETLSIYADSSTTKGREMVSGSRMAWGNFGQWVGGQDGELCGSRMAWGNFGQGVGEHVGGLCGSRMAWGNFGQCVGEHDGEVWQ